MRFGLLLLTFLFLYLIPINTSQAQTPDNPIAEKTAEMEKHEGFFDFYWDTKRECRQINTKQKIIERKHHHHLDISAKQTQAVSW